MNIAENKNEGYICIYRSLKKHWIWDNEKYFKWWVWMLFKANHKENKVNIGLEIFTYQRGSFITSLNHLSAAWLSKVGVIRGFLNLLQKDGMIIIKTTNKFTQITICNYDNYQSNEQTNNKQNANKTQTDNKQNATNKNEEECLKNVNNEYISEIEKLKTEINTLKEKKIKTKFIPPTIEDVIDYFKENGYSTDAGKKAFNYYNINNWKDSKGSQVKNWKQKMQGVWFKDENKQKIVGNGLTATEDFEIDYTRTQW